MISQRRPVPLVGAGILIARTSRRGPGRPVSGRDRSPPFSGSAFRGYNPRPASSGLRRVAASASGFARPASEARGSNERWPLPIGISRGFREARFHRKRRDGEPPARRRMLIRDSPLGDCAATPPTTGGATTRLRVALTICRALSSSTFVNSVSNAIMEILRYRRTFSRGNCERCRELSRIVASRREGLKCSAVVCLGSGAPRFCYARTPRVRGRALTLANFFYC